MTLDSNLFGVLPQQQPRSLTPEKRYELKKVLSAGEVTGSDKNISKKQIRFIKENESLVDRRGCRSSPTTQMLSRKERQIILELIRLSCRPKIDIYCWLVNQFNSLETYTQPGANRLFKMVSGNTTPKRKPFHELPEVQHVNYTRKGRIAQKPGRKPKSTSLPDPSKEQVKWRISAWYVCFENRPDIQKIYLVAMEDATLFMKSAQWEKDGLSQLIRTLHQEAQGSISHIELTCDSDGDMFGLECRIKEKSCQIRKRTTLDVIQKLNRMGITQIEIGNVEPSASFGTIYLGITDKKHKDSILSAIDAEIDQIIKNANKSFGKRTNRNGGFDSYPETLHKARQDQLLKNKNAHMSKPK